MRLRRRRRDDDDHDHGHTVTVGRAVAAGETSGGRSGPADATTRRVVLGTAAGVVCLLAVAVSLLVFGRGGDDDTTTPSTGPVTTQLLQFRPPPPQGVTVLPASEPGTVVVAWQAVGEPGDGMRYQVRPQTAGMQPQNTDQLSITFTGVAAGDRPCYTVVAITTDGRTLRREHPLLPLTSMASFARSSLARRVSLRLAAPASGRHST